MLILLFPCISETVCTNIIPHGTIDASCLDSKVDDSCENFTCDSDYLKKANVGQFNCTEDGTWDYDLSTLCTGTSLRHHGMHQYLCYKAGMIMFHITKHGYSL